MSTMGRVHSVVVWRLSRREAEWQAANLSR